MELALPEEMVSCVEVFKEFYETRTKHRKLTWIYALGVCTLNGKFSPRPIELQVGLIKVDLAAHPGCHSPPVFFGAMLSRIVRVRVRVINQSNGEGECDQPIKQNQGG